MKRVNAFVATYQDQKKQLEEINQSHSESPPQEEGGTTEQKIEAIKSISTTEKSPATARKVVSESVKSSKKGEHLKQVNLTIGEDREFKLDDLAHEYSKRKKYRVNRNDIVRYLIDTVTVDDLLGVDLSEHEK